MDFYVPAYVQYQAIKAINGGTPPADATRTVQLTVPVGGGPDYFVPAIGQEIRSLMFTTDTGVTAMAFPDDSGAGVNKWVFWEAGGAGTIVESPQTTPLFTYDFAQRVPSFNVEDPSALSSALAGASTFVIVAELKEADTWGDADPGNAVLVSWQKNVANYNPDLTSQLVTLDQRIRSRGNQFLTPSGVAVNGAAAGFLGPGVVTYVGPTDIGGGPDQLPPDPINLTADLLENHPTVFVRASESVRAVGSLYSEGQPRDLALLSTGIPLLHIDQPGNVVSKINAQPLVIDRPPTFTEWTIILDGVLYRGWFEVPNGNPNGLIRPRDLYQAIFARASGQDGDRPTWIYLPGLTPDGVVYYPQQLLRSMDFLAYARISGYADAEGPIIGTPVYQQEEPPPN